MRKITVSLLMLTISAGFIRADLIAVESFDGAGYNDETSLIGLNGGSGWGGAWTDRIYNVNVEVDAGTLQYPGAPSAGNRATARFSSGADRPFDTTPGGAFDGYIDENGYIGTNGTTLWWGMQAYDASTFLRVRLLQDTSESLLIGDPDASNYEFASPGVDDVLIPMADSTQLFFAVRMDFIAGTDADVARLWINPDVTLGQAGLGAPDAILTNDFAFNGFGFSLGGNEVSFVDEIRIGETFNDVAVPEPGTLAFFGIGFALVRFLRRRKA